jgi:hypothetical protein
MRNWIPLSKIVIADWYSRKLRGEAEKLNARIEEALQGRAELEKTATRILGAKAATISSDDLFAAHELTTLEFDLLQRERKLLEDLDRFHEQRMGEVAPVQRKAYEAHQAARAKVEADILAIGFRRDHPSQHPAGRFGPAMINAHPSVVGTLREYETLCNVNRPSFAKSLVQIAERMETIRSHRAR